MLEGKQILIEQIRKVLINQNSEQQNEVWVISFLTIFSNLEYYLEGEKTSMLLICWQSDR